MKFQTLPFLVLLLLFFIGCSSSTDIYFVEESGVISIEGESAADNDSWEMVHYYTGEGMRALNVDQLPAGRYSPLTYTISVDTPGEFTVWLLTRRNHVTPGVNRVLVGIASDVASIPSPLATAIIDQGNLNALQWRSEDRDGAAARFRLPTAGKYTFFIDNEGVAGAHIDKIALVRTGARAPEGVGIPETCMNCERVIAPKPILPPAWAFGVLYGGYTNQDESVERVARIISEDLPIDAYWIDSWFWDYLDEGRGPQGYKNFTGDLVAYPNQREMWSWMDDHHVKSGIWVWNTILQDSNEVVFEDFKSRGFFSSVYLNRDRWHNQHGNSMTGDIDFENPDAVEYWQSLLKPFFDRGVDFLKLDRSSDYPFLKANFEATQKFASHENARGFILAHLHSTHDYRHLKFPTKWTGDAKTDWNQPNYPDMSVYAMGALRENIWMMANPRLSTYGIPFLTQDTGGYDFYGSTELGDELFTRWVQFAVFNPVMHFFSHSRNHTSNLPYNFSPRTLQVTRELLHLRMQLIPYTYSYAIKTHETGEKMIRGDGIHINQYMYGDAFLVAPVYEKGATSRDVYLPEGVWYNWYTGASVSGNQTINVSAPIDQIPLFVRAGSIIPMRDYARAVELGSNDTLRVHIYPGTNGSFTLHEDDGVTTDYESGRYATTTFTLEQSMSNPELFFTISAIEGDYNGMTDERFYEIIVHGNDRFTTARVGSSGETQTIRNNRVTFTQRKSEEITIRISR